jgi:Zinc dependent phospholipase C
MSVSLVSNVSAYSVLTHEAIVDATWKQDIEPLLLSRFPTATREQLLRAHAYAYGGAIIQDMGYYPLGSRFFSDLTHYVRSGDFVLALLQESHDLDEYAFALGALSHYAADNDGHELATNRCVPLLYPKLARHYGSVVTYEDKPIAHMKVEYGFDVDQVAKGNYAPHAYHDLIGFEVSESLLERAFASTYSLDLSSIFFSVDLAIGTYRHSASSVIPSMTKVAWHMKKDEIQHSHPSETKKQFIYHISNSGYRQEWGNVYEKPGFWAKFKAALLRVVPKVGPFSALAFHPPTPAVESLYMQSFNETLDHYRTLLRAQLEGHLELPNHNLDTGRDTGGAAYRLADETYANLLLRVSGKPISPELAHDLLLYYADVNRPYVTKRDPKEWRRVTTALAVVRANSQVPAQ